MDGLHALNYSTNGVDHDVQGSIQVTEKQDFPHTIYYETAGRVMIPEMKVYEKAPPSPNQPELPAHSTEDEGDFAGVVDGPTKNVREIRAMFKNGPDYANYAKPKLVPVKNKPALPPKPRKETIIKSRPNSGPSQEVAQQVIGLFKGALTLDEGNPAPPTAPKPTQNGNGEIHDNGPHISVKDKVASFNVGKSPVQEEEVNNNVISDVIQSPKTPVKVESPPPTPYTPYAEIISNPSPKSSKTFILESVKKETPKAESYDESLDQFDAIFEELSAS